MTSAPNARRVVVTGMGGVSPWGWGIAPLRRALAAGDCAIRSVTRFDATSFPSQIAAEVPPPPPELARSIRGWSRLSFADRYAVAAALEALRSADWPTSPELTTGVFFGSSTGGMWETERFYESWRHRCLERAPRHALATQPVDRPAEAVARAIGASGTVMTVSSACASATLAIGEALDAVRSGDVAIAIAGGADSLCRVTFGGFNALRSVDPRPCRPFRADREGLSLGEGGAALVLEPLESALARGARPLAELCGAGASADVHHMTAPDPQGRGAALALARALEDGACESARVGGINAHGTGTPLNDPAEFHAYERLFGSRAREIPVMVTKASVGHLLGAAGAIEAVATILALVEQRLQPSPGSGAIDPEIPVRLPASSASNALDAMVSINLGFGGCNGAIVLARWSGS